MSLEGQISALATRLGAEIKALKGVRVPRNFSFVRDFAVSTVTTTAWTNKLELTFSVAAADTGLYRLEWAYSWNYDGTGNDFWAQVLIDGQVFREHRQEPKDAAGTFASTGSNQRFLTSSFTLLDLAAGPHTFVLRFRPQQGGRRASMWDASATAQLVKEA